MKTKTKVLHIVSGWGTGGVERYISNYANIMYDFSFDILTIMSCSESSIFTNVIIKKGGKIYKIPNTHHGNTIQRLRRRVKFIKNFIASNQYEIVHVNGGTADFLLYAYAVKKVNKNIKVVMHCHGDNVEPPHVFQKKIFHSVFKYIFNLVADYCLGCSQNTMNWMYTNRTLKRKPSRVLSCGIDIDRFTFSERNRQLLRKDLRCEGKFIVGTIGRFSPQKNPTYTLEIIDELIKINNNVIFLWIGAGDLINKVKSKAKELCIDNKIIFYGVSNQIPQMLSVMDVFILPSIFEGNPIVGLEAQANGIKCFFSNKIVKEAKISDTVEFLPVDIPAAEWANKINVYSDGYERYNTKNQIIEAGQDVFSCANELKKIYQLLLK